MRRRNTMNILTSSTFPAMYTTQRKSRLNSYGLNTEFFRVSPP